MRILIMVNAVLSVILWLVAALGAKTTAARVNCYGSSVLLLLWAVALFLATTLGGML
ncbi:MAG: hypothetical protein IKG87_02750 [Clostridia bacterium]|nr:hypothetical protein [Clostridia bacterium]